MSAVKNGTPNKKKKVFNQRPPKWAIYSVSPLSQLYTGIFLFLRIINRLFTTLQSDNIIANSRPILVYSYAQIIGTV